MDSNESARRFWATVLAPEVHSKFFKPRTSSLLIRLGVCDGSMPTLLENQQLRRAMNDDLLEILDVHLPNSRSGVAPLVIFRRFQEVSGIVVAEYVIDEIELDVSKFFSRATPFARDSVSGLSPVTKSLNVIQFSQSYLYRRLGQRAFHRNNLDEARRFFRRSYSLLSDQISSKACLRNRSQCLEGLLRCWCRENDAPRIDNALLPVLSVTEDFYRQALNLDPNDPQSLVKFGLFLEEWFPHKNRLCHDYAACALMLSPGYATAKHLLRRMEMALGIEQKDGSFSDVANEVRSVELQTTMTLLTPVDDTDG
jgi:hypothetical protein